MTKPSVSPPDRFRAAQQPLMWFLSAERLRDAAEVILADQVRQETAFFQARHDAAIRGIGEAHREQDGVANVEIQAMPPNYLPAQLLYAFAIENALKGLAVARNPGLVNDTSLSRRIKSHDLLKVAKEAAFAVPAQEVPILKALSHIAEWVGRYPVASGIEKYNDHKRRDSNEEINLYPFDLHPEALLDWGSQNPAMRECFARMIRELEGLLPHPPQRLNYITVMRPPGVAQSPPDQGPHLR